LANDGRIGGPLPGDLRGEIESVGKQISPSIGPTYIDLDARIASTKT